MAIERVLKFYSLHLCKLRNNFYIQNSIVNLICRIFGSGGNNLLLDRIAGENKSCEMHNKIYDQADEQGLSNVVSDNILWMAAPKKRTSRKTKWLRHQRKFIKNREDVETCSVCGNAKLINHLCGICFERIQQATDEILKDIQSHPSFWRPSVPENLKKFYKQ
jgi:ribosomal protein L32